MEPQMPIKTKLIYCYGRIEKSSMVDDAFIFPSYGDKVNEFNKFLIVREVANIKGEIYITLKDD